MLLSMRPGRLRHYVIAARDLEAVCNQIYSALDLEPTPKSDGPEPTLAFGFRTHMMRIGTTMLELVSPIREKHQLQDFFVERGGDGGEGPLKGDEGVFGDEDAGREGREAARLRAAEADGEHRIAFAIDFAVSALRIAEPMMPDSLRTPVLVGIGVEKALGIGGPDQAVAPVLDDVGKLRAGYEIADFQHVAFGAVGVDRIGEELVIRAVCLGAEIPVRLAVGLRIAVEQDLLLSPAARAPAEPRILPAFDEVRVVVERTVGRRH